MLVIEVKHGTKDSNGTHDSDSNQVSHLPEGKAVEGEEYWRIEGPDDKSRYSTVIQSGHPHHDLL